MLVRVIRSPSDTVWPPGRSPAPTAFHGVPGAQSKPPAHGAAVPGSVLRRPRQWPPAWMGRRCRLTHFMGSLR